MWASVHATTDFLEATMGTLSSGVGIISGLQINDIVGKLMSIEKRPADLLQTRIQGNTKVRDALQSLTLKLVSLNLSASQLGAGRSFSNRSATASSDALVVSAGPGASLGSFTITPSRLASTSQLLSAGLSSQSSLVGAGTLTLKQGGFVDRDTRLSVLNGGAGVRVGSIRITDQAGQSSLVDLAGASTIGQVVESINAGSGANIRASLVGGSLRLTDLSGGAGVLTVADVAGGSTATDLGLTQLNQNGAAYTGAQTLKLANGIDLGELNDGAGVRQIQGLADFSISAGSVSFSVDLDNARTIGDVITAINGAAGNTGGKIVADIATDGKGIRLRDAIANDDITVTAANSSKAAADLGLLGPSGAGGTLAGRDIIGGLQTVLLRSLKGGSGSIVAGQININGNSVDLSNATTLRDVIDGVNNAGIAGISASINSARDGVVLTKSTAGGLDVSDASGNLSASLGLTVSAAAGVNTKNGGDLQFQFISENTRLRNLNGGVGVPKGVFRIVDGNGVGANIDLSGEQDYSVGDVLRNINSRGIGVTARINDAGDGILLERTSGSSALQVFEQNGGGVAKSLNLLGTPTAGGAQVDGSFTTKIALAATDTLKDVVTKIAASGAPVTAAILNDGSSLIPYRLSLTSKQSGLVGELLVDAGSTNLTFATTAKASDAVALLGSGTPGSTPVQLTSSNSSLSGIIPGLTVNVVKTQSTPVTVTVTENQKSVTDAVSAFVDGFNSLIKEIDDNSTFNATTGEKGIFFTESPVRLARQRLQSFVNTAFTGTGSNLKTLGSIGLSFDSSGKLQLDAAQFSNAFSQNATDVERLFTAANNGVVAKFQKLTDELSDVSNGFLVNRENALTRTIESQNDSLDRINIRLTATQTRLFNRFYSLETALAKLQSQQATLSQLASLSGTTFTSTKTS